MDVDHANANANANTDVDTDVDASDNLAQKTLENERVLAQLGRRFDDVQNTHRTHTTHELTMASSVAQTLWDECITMERTYADPNRNNPNSFTSGYHNSARLHGVKSNSILSYVTGRSYGVGKMKQKRGPLRQIVGSSCSIPSFIRTATTQRIQSYLPRRMSHVVTINSHLFCPVYCLRFDRTGRYFVTGADDNLVKLFRIGSGVKGDTLREKQKYDATHADVSCQRGAILVCTLRGHASVITDIDVSADNALLATASEDGDVRVWGMTDGCPVAILRGHDGGANMVSEL